jgi:hypothetical protein
MHHTAATLIFALPILLLVLLSLLSGILMIVGGLKMLRLESYGWSLAACIVAVLPFNPVGILGLVVGIWGLVVLNQRDVRKAFQRGAPRMPADGPGGNTAWIFWVAIALACVLLLVPAAVVLGYFLMAF